MTFWRTCSKGVTVLLTAVWIVSGCDRDDSGGTGATSAASSQGVIPVVSRAGPTTLDTSPATRLYRALLYSQIDQVRQVLEEKP